MKKIALVAFLSFFIGILFGAALFGRPTTKIENQDVKSAVSTVTPEQAEIVSETVGTSSPKKDLYQIVKVIDGDTISVNINGKIEAIRLIGIDSPESVDPRKPVQCFGKEASEKAKEVLTGKKVSLEYDPTQGDKDKYKRLLRFVFLEDGTNFNKFMISEGFAHEYTYSTVYKYQTEFRTAEKEARENSKGLWAEGACLIPTQKPQELQKSQEPTPTINIVSSGNFSCAGKTTCGQMASCEEATFYLNNCGLSRLDGDKDGVPCETLCR